uniref:Knotted 1-binding protein 36 n=1 Tax=Noccaea caerulescens TaxID=107243 RepID=A0A1J3CPE4_NOCCA
MEQGAGNEGSRKRMKLSDEEEKGDPIDGMSLLDTVDNEETETTKLAASDEMELNIAQILDKIESFTQTVSNLLESGKTMFKDLSNELEERLVMIHKERVEKWQEEIKELRLLDASNEETASLLHNARFLIQNPSIEP